MRHIATCISAAEVDRLDAWARQNDYTRSKAMRLLLDIGLQSVQARHTNLQTSAEE